MGFSFTSQYFFFIIVNYTMPSLSKRMIKLEKHMITYIFNENLF